MIGVFYTITHKIDIYYKKYKKSIDKVYISDIYDNLKSGDIILFNNYQWAPISYAIVDSCYTHAEIIIKYNDFDVKKYKLKQNLYSVEFCANGLQTHELLLKIKNFGSNCSIFTLNKEITEKMYKKFLKLIHSKQEIYYILWKNIFKKIIYWGRIMIHCFQYILYILDQLKLTNNLLKRRDMIKSVNTVSNINNEKLNFGYKYNKAVKVVYN
jgi:hypothetical protein